VPVLRRFLRSRAISPVAALETRSRDYTGLRNGEVEEHAIVGHVALYCTVSLRDTIRVGRVTFEISNGTFWWSTARTLRRFTTLLRALDAGTTKERTILCLHDAGCRNPLEAGLHAEVADCTVLYFASYNDMYSAGFLATRDGDRT
jgi:hypothetical protein